MCLLIGQNEIVQEEGNTKLKNKTKRVKLDELVTKGEL